MGGGFLCGSGWLLLIGSLRVMTGKPVALENVADLVAPGSLRLWAPGVAIGAAIFLAQRWQKKTMWPPLILLSAIVIFYATTSLIGISPEQARADGWLPQISQQVDFRPRLWSVEAWKSVDFLALARAGGLAATASLTALISILLNSSGLELIAQSEIDLNQELRVAGIANILSGLAGGMLGFQSLSFSRLAHDMGSRNRLAGVITALLCGLALVAGPAVFSYLPKFVFGGLLFYLGLGFLVDRLYDGWGKLVSSDYVVVLLIVAVMAVDWIHRGGWVGHPGGGLPFYS